MSTFQVAIASFFLLAVADSQQLPRNCAEVQLVNPDAKCGVYSISPIPGTVSKVFCDMAYRGGGWTVFQRRGTPIKPGFERQNFYLDWKSYETGFGSADSDYWIGLAALGVLTRMEDSELSIRLESWENETKIAEYEVFQVGPSADGYKLSVAGFRDVNGGVGDSLLRHNGMKFSTKDRDQDTHPPNSCSVMYAGAWWYEKCHSSNLNGLYNGSESSHGTGIDWNSWKGHNYSMRFVEMKVRSKGWKDPSSSSLRFDNNLGLNSTYDNK